MGIYLDNASTTKPRQEVIDVAVEYMKDKWYNPSSLYSAGYQVKKDINNVRKSIADLINANNDEVFFTSGACEANSWVIRGFDDIAHCSADGTKNIPSVQSAIITTTIEHQSLIDAVSNPMLYSDVCFCNVDNNGFVDMDELERHLYKYVEYSDSILVSVIAANNEIGTIQHLKEISNLVHDYNGIFHTDATQLIGQMRIDVDELGIDLMSASAQKLGGLKGCGFLYKKNDIDLMPLIYGSQESYQRGGTENVVGIMALGEAIKHIDYKKQRFVASMRDHFINQLIKMGCKLNGDKEHRLPNNINVMLPDGVSGEGMVYILDTSGIMVSTGSACNSHSISSSHVLKSIGMSNEEAMRSIRITLPQDITVLDIDRAANEIRNCIKLLRS